MTDNLINELFDEAEALQDVDVTKTRTLSDAVRQLRSVEADLDQLEEARKALNTQKHSLQTDLIPAIMQEMGIERVDVDDVSVTVGMVSSAKIPDERRDEAFEWLNDHGHGALIKNDVLLSFGMGQQEACDRAIDVLEAVGLEPEVKTHVHPSTLKAFVLEQFREGNPIDLDMFGAFVSPIARLRRK